MKKMENSFVVSGFVGKDASIHQFSTASVARFPLAISRTREIRRGNNPHFRFHKRRDMAQE